MAGSPAERTVELTPEQWTRLMERLGDNYGAFDNAVAYNGSGYMYSRTFIVQGNNQGEINAAGFRAVAENGTGALASVEVRYATGSSSPTSFSVTTSDPTVLRALEAIRTRQQARETISDIYRRMMESMQQMREPDIRARTMEEAIRIMMSPETAPTTPARQRGEAAAQSPTAGRDRILGNVGRAFGGTSFSAPDPLSLAAIEHRARSVDPGIVMDLGPSTAVPMPTIGGGPNTGMMRYMEADGSSSVFAGERRLYTDYSISERNPFRPGESRPAGTLRIYGDLGRPERYEIITDNPALRQAAERANIPVSPATLPVPQQRERQR
ncbi:MAG: hypothetical protein AB1324_03835 [Candidatus Micrarchaeota archaeon]